MDYTLLKKEIETKTLLKGTKQGHALKFLKLLYDNTNGVSNLNELPIQYLNRFFKSAQTRIVVIKELLNGGFIEKTDNYIVGTKSKSYRISNQYLPDEKKSQLSIMKINIDGTIDEDVFFNAKPGPEGYEEMFGLDKKEVIFKYKGFGDDLKYIVTKEQKEQVKEIKKTFGKYLHQAGFIDACKEKGIDEKLAWFFFNKIQNNNQSNDI